jgi:hypothetical protein
MSLAPQFRQNAEECRRLAKTMQTEEQRRALLDFAEMWDQRARDAEAQENTPPLDEERA